MFGNLLKRLRKGNNGSGASAIAHGSISVSGGTVSVERPSEGGRPARIAPGQGVDVFVNEVQITEPVDVLPEDHISLVVADTVPNADRYSLVVAPDKQAVTLDVNPDGVYAVANQVKAGLLTPRLTHAPGTTVTVSEVEGALAQMGVCFGVSESAIAKAVTNLSAGPDPIAVGIPVTPGHDTELEWLVTEPAISEPLAERIDFREQPPPLTVEIGMVMAKVIEAVPAQPGKTVFGDEVPCAPIRKRSVKAGPGVTLTQEGEFTAQIDGRPKCVEDDKSIRVTVVPVFEHRGDVDLTSGHLRVKGHVLVVGNVTENMEVSATGDVTVTGNVTRAQIRAGGSISVQAITLASRLTAGVETPSENVLGPGLAQLDELIGALLKLVIRRLKTRKLDLEEMERRGIGPFVQVTIDQELRQLPEVVAEVAALVTQTPEIDDDTQELLSTLLQTPLLEGRVHQIRELAALNDVRDLIEEIRSNLDAGSTRDAHIRVANCEHSELEASGNVEVAVGGAYLSTIRARQFIRVWGPLIGGSLHSGERIDLAQAGNEAGVVTLLEVPDEGGIWADQAYPGVQFRLGIIELRVEDPGPLAQGAPSQQQAPIIKQSR